MKGACGKKKKKTKNQNKYIQKDNMNKTLLTFDTDSLQVRPFGIRAAQTQKHPQFHQAVVKPYPPRLLHRLRRQIDGDMGKPIVMAYKEQK